MPLLLLYVQCLFLLSVFVLAVCRNHYVSSVKGIAAHWGSYSCQRLCNSSSCADLRGEITSWFHTKKINKKSCVPVSAFHSSPPLTFCLFISSLRRRLQQLVFLNLFLLSHDEPRGILLLCRNPPALFYGPSFSFYFLSIVALICSFTEYSAAAHCARCALRTHCAFNAHACGVCLSRRGDILVYLPSRQEFDQKIQHAHAKIGSDICIASLAIKTTIRCEMQKTESVFNRWRPSVKHAGRRILFQTNPAG